MTLTASSRPRRVPTTLLLLGVLAASATACNPGQEPTPAAEPSPDTVGSTHSPSTSGTPAAETSDTVPLFTDIAAEAGLDFVHENGRSGQRYFVEPVGAGAVLADFDGDGDLDAFLVQGHLLDPNAVDSAAAKTRTGGRLFRNDLETTDAPDSPSRLRFIDVTENSGLRAEGYGMGAATGDFDNDGRIDLYLTNFGANQLWRNVSSIDELRFEDVTAAAGVDDPRWSTSASFADLDGDGWLDLYVANYVDFTLARHRSCRSPGGRLDYCGPQSYEGEPDRLFWNRGDGTFEDITAVAGVLDSPSSGLGVVAADFDRDGRLDLYVANDLRRNFQWQNLGGSPPHFENVALESGSAVSMLGHAQASMGVVAGDVDNDGDDDLFMTHLSTDTNTYYQNDGHGLFYDRSAASGLGAPSLDGTGFGTALIDIDNDGWLDVVVANGAVKIIEAQVRSGESYPLKQVNQLFVNRAGTFTEVPTAQAGESFGQLEVSRGIAVGDVDNDGCSDVLLANNEGPARLLHNSCTNGHAWIGLQLHTRTGRDALGAQVEVVRADGSRLWRRAATDGSYLSASDPRVLVGLGAPVDPGAQTEVDTVRVLWPSGRREIWAGLSAGVYHTLTEGEGLPDPDEAP